MEIKKKITKKIMVKLALFVAVIGIAFLFDTYFDKNPEELKEIQSESKEHSKEQNTVYLISQTNWVGAKTSVQKTVTRKIQPKSYDKFVQKYHQLRNYQVLKAEVHLHTSPLISTYHYLAFKNYFFTNPDDDPLGA